MRPIHRRTKAPLSTPSREDGRRAESALIAGITQQTVSAHRKKDPDFAERVEEAVDLWRDIVLEREAHRRGIEGWDEPLYHRGKLTGHTIRKRSDRILVMLYERHCGRTPEVQVNVAPRPIAVIQRATSGEEWLQQNREVAENANFESVQRS